MKIKLKKFNILHSTKFILLSLNPKTSKELSNNFYYYFYRGIKGLFVKEDSYKFAIYVKKKFVGSISFYLNKGEYELGYFILPQYHGKGIATKAIKEMTNYIFNKLNFKKIKAVTNSNNLSSIKTLRKNGFKIIKRNKKAKELIFERKRK